jgi:hypothetical protein
MSGLEVAVFTALWVVLLALGTLVLVLYRLVDRAYRLGATADAALAPGSQAPEIEVLSADGSVMVIDPTEEPGRLTLAFVRSGCEACTELMDELAPDGLGPNTIALVNGEGFNEYANGSRGLKTLWLAHPPNVIRDYGVTVAPLVFVLKDGVVLAAKSISTRPEFERLVEAADGMEQELAGGLTAAGGSTAE